MGIVLAFEGLTKEYRSFVGRRRLRALDNFTLHVETGEIFGFLGPNGAGKTTAIHLAMGFMYPTHGRGRMLEKPFGHAPTRRRVGFLAENVALYHRKAEGVLRFYGGLNGVSGARLAAQVREVLQVVGLEDQANRNVGKFSRGMVQRIGLAQALVNDPELLILDEPTSAMDPLARVAVRELLLKLREAGKTIFLSSHLLSEIELVCDRIAVLHRGKMVRMGCTSDLLQAGEELEITVRDLIDGVLREFPSRRAINENGSGRAFSVPRAKLREVLERIWNSGGEVVSVIPVRRSLEEMFLQLTSDLPSEPIKSPFHATEGIR